MESRAEMLEALLWDLDEFYPDSRHIHAAWEEFEETGDLPMKMVKKLKRMLNRAIAGTRAA